MNLDAAPPHNAASGLRRTRRPATQLDDDAITDIALRVREALSSPNVVLEQKIQVGKIVFESIYEGRDENLRRRSFRPQSLRRVASGIRDRSSFKPSTTELRHCAQVFALHRRINLLDPNGLTWAHVRQVLRYPLDDQARMLKEARTEGWASRDLTRAIRRRVEGGGRPQRGRTLKSSLRHVIEAAHAMVQRELGEPGATAGDALPDPKGTLPSVPPAALLRTADQAEALAAWFQQLATTLRSARRD